MKHGKKETKKNRKRMRRDGFGKGINKEKEEFV